MILKSAFLPRVLVFFSGEWEIVFQNQDLGAEYADCYWDSHQLLLLLGPFWQGLVNYVISKKWKFILIPVSTSTEFFLFLFLNSTLSPIVRTLALFSTTWIQQNYDKPKSWQTYHVKFLCNSFQRIVLQLYPFEIVSLFNIGSLSKSTKEKELKPRLFFDTKTWGPERARTKDLSEMGLWLVA